MMERSFPTGTVTFLFTDIEGSTRLRQAQPEEYKASLAQHNTLLRQAVEAHDGFVFKVIGDAFCAAFATAPEALRAALGAQRALQAAGWGAAPLRVRMALHTGAAELRDGDYWGFTLARAARLLPAGHGGQVLVSRSTADLLADDLPEGVRLHDLGEHRLRDLVRPEHIFQLAADGLPDSFPPLKSLDGSPHNLPIQLTSFIGRDKEIADVKRLMGAARLLTLVGPGGTGKTRVSLQAAAEVLETFPDGGWLVELAPIADPHLVPQTVAAALGVRESSSGPLLTMLENYLRDKSLLLVMDNCEHLLGACAQLADQLLHAAPRLRILASSREGLGIAGETTYRVPSLTLPDVNHLPPLDSLTQYEAVRLFIERAQAIQPAFAVTNARAPAVAQICHQLDGIPLAIELAAARVRSLSVEQIAARLDDRFRLLTSGSRTALPRHQTLRAAVDWSFDLLSSSERVLFRRLAVFAGGWTLEAAEHICVGGEVNDPLDLLDSLVNKSLVAAAPGEQTVRYAMLATIRHYAQEKLLESADAEVVRTRHLDFYLRLAELAEPHLRRAEQLEWLARLDAEPDNLRAALEWAVEAAPAAVPEAALRLVVALARYWENRGQHTESKAWRERALAQGDPRPSAVRARALYYYAGDVSTGTWGQTSRPIYEQALAMAEAVGDTATQAHALMFLGDEAETEGNMPSPQLARALALFEALGDVWGQANTLNHMSQVQAGRGNTRLAEELMRQALSLWRQTGDRSTICHALIYLADAAMLRGELDRAQALLDEAAPLVKESGHVDVIALGLHISAQIAYRQAAYAQVEQLYEQYHAIKNNIGEKVLALAARHWQGVAACCQGDYARALRLQQPVLDGLRAVGAPFPIHWAQMRMALTHIDRGEVEQACELLEPACAYFTGDKINLGEALHLLGRAKYYHGDLARAAELVEESLSLSHASGDAWLRALALHSLGRLRLALGDDARAAEQIREGLAICRRMGARRQIAEALEGLAALALRQPQPKRAARLLGAAAALRAQIGAPVPLVERTEHERMVALTRQGLDEVAFTATWAEGQATSWDDAAGGALTDS